MPNKSATTTDFEPLPEAEPAVRSCLLGLFGRPGSNWGSGRMTVISWLLSERVRRFCLVATLQEMRRICSDATVQDAEDVFFGFVETGLDGVVRSYKPTYKPALGEKPPVSFPPYFIFCLRRHARRKAIKLRREYERQAQEPPVPVAPPQQEGQESDTELIRRSVEQAIAELARSQSQFAHILELTYVDDLEPREIAERLGISAVNARVRLLRARRQIRPILLAQMLVLFQDRSPDHSTPASALRAEVKDLALSDENLLQLVRLVLVEGMGMDELRTRINESVR